MRRVTGMLFVLAVLGTLAGCGQKGPLTLPPPRPNTPPAAPAAAHPPAPAATAAPASSRSG